MPALTVPRLTAPIAPTVAAQLVNFAPVKKSHVMLNSRPVPMETMFGAHMMTVPPCNVVHGMRADGTLEPWSKADLDADGDPIPGSYVIEDRYEWDPNQQAEVLVMDADRAVRLIFGIVRRPDGSASELSSKRALVGLSLIPRNQPKAVWQAVAREGEHRAFLASVVQAEYAVEAYKHRNELDRSAGLPSKPVGPELQHHLAVLKQFNALAAEESAAALAPFREIEEAQTAADDLRFEVYLKTRIMSLAAEAAESQNLDKKKVFDGLMNDPEVRKHAQKEYRMRKKGHLPIPEEDLDAAAELGQNVNEAGIE